MSVTKVAPPPEPRINAAMGRTFSGARPSAFNGSSTQDAGPPLSPGADPGVRESRLRVVQSPLPAQSRSLMAFPR